MAKFSKKFIARFEEISHENKALRDLVVKRLNKEVELLEKIKVLENSAIIHREDWIKQEEVILEMSKELNNTISQAIDDLSIVNGKLSVAEDKISYYETNANIEFCGGNFLDHIKHRDFE